MPISSITPHNIIIRTRGREGEEREGGGVFLQNIKYILLKYKLAVRYTDFFNCQTLSIFIHVTRDSYNSLQIVHELLNSINLQHKCCKLRLLLDLILYAFLCSSCFPNVLSYNALDARSRRISLSVILFHNTWH